MTYIVCDDGGGGVAAAEETLERVSVDNQVVDTASSLELLANDGRRNVAAGVVGEVVPAKAPHQLVPKAGALGGALAGLEAALPRRLSRGGGNWRVAGTLDTLSGLVNNLGRRVETPLAELVLGGGLVLRVWVEWSVREGDLELDVLGVLGQVRNDVAILVVRDAVMQRIVEGEGFWAQRGRWCWRGSKARSGQRGSACLCACRRGA